MHKFGKTFFIGIFPLFIGGCNSGATSVPNNGVKADIVSLANQIVYFSYGEGVESLTVVYVDSRLSNGQKVSNFNTANSNGLLTLTFYSGVNNSTSDIANLFNANNTNPNTGEVGIIGFSDVDSQPSDLYFYIITDLYINGSPIIDIKGDFNTPGKLYIALGANWVFYDWWVGFKYAGLDCGGTALGVSTLNGKSYFIKPYHNGNKNRFEVSTNSGC